MSAPYYSDERVVLYHGNCLELADLWTCADVLVTDPPYGIAFRLHGGGVGTTRTRKHAGIYGDDDTSTRDAALALWGNEKPGAVFGSFKAPSPAGVRHHLIWKKPPNAGLIGSTIGYRTDLEPIYLIGNHPKRSASRSSVVESSGSINSYLTEHPHAKPSAMLCYLASWLPGIIADPFAGSGSTLVAAKALGRKAIGVELEERYCEIAARRLAQDALDFGEPA